MSSESLIAQSDLSFGSSGIHHEDTLHIGDSIHFNFWLVNQGNSIINDSILMSCETFDILGIPISAMSIGNSYNTSGSLNVGDSIAVTITELVTYQSYVLGDNIIVIWPALIGVGTGDTSTTNIHILDSVSTGDKLEISGNKLIIYPNPIKDYFTISNKLGLPISNIAMSDHLGRLIYNDKRIHHEPINLHFSNLNSGTYFIEAIVDHQRIIRKVILIK
tara:strand:- start:68 stop:724 length:657 start_codon:yes stop_codon:yes gene_type:complete